MPETKPKNVACQATFSGGHSASIRQFARNPPSNQLPPKYSGTDPSRQRDRPRRVLEGQTSSRPLVASLFQTGYLTIKGFGRTGTISRYKLGFPNKEVESSFLEDLSALYVGRDSSDPGGIVARIGDTLRARDPEGFVEAFKSFFGSIPYDLTDRQNEQSWQAVMYEA